MRTTIHKKDLTKADGFPSDIDRTKLVVVQIVENPMERYNIVCYCNKLGKQTSWFLPNELSEKYAEGIYIIR